jgi:hypothetical protein
MEGSLVDEKAATPVVWREAFAIIRKYPLAAIAPAAVLGALAEAPAYLIEDRPVLGNALTYLTAALAYYLFLAYAEEIAAEYQRGVARITLRGMLRELREAAPFVPRVLAAGLVTLSIASVATGLLVIPGVWLFTRWSLAIPAIRGEDLGFVAALKRSNRLVRGRFWFILGTATLAFVLEEALIHVGALAGYLVSGSHTWGEWVGGSIFASLVIPLAALTTSVAYSSVSRPAESTEGA